MLQSTNLCSVASCHGAPEALGGDVSQDFVQSRVAGGLVKSDHVQGGDGSVQVAVGVDVKCWQYLGETGGGKRGKGEWDKLK